jgi:hypothetical protein
VLKVTRAWIFTSNLFVATAGFDVEFFLKLTFFFGAFFEWVTRKLFRSGRLIIPQFPKPFSGFIQFDMGELY